VRAARKVDATRVEADHAIDVLIRDKEFREFLKKEDARPQVDLASVDGHPVLKCGQGEHTTTYRTTMRRTFPRTLNMGKG